MLREQDRRGSRKAAAHPARATRARPEPASPGRHLAYVDALRGVAFLMVLVAHVSYLVPGLPRAILRFTDRGVYGVQLFFLASAFTLFLSIEQRSGEELSPTRNFFFRRLFRIAPMFWAAMVLYTLVDGLGASYYAPDGLHWQAIAATAVFWHGWHPDSINNVVPGGWSIAVEMNFYLLVPLLFAWISTLRRAVIFTIVTGAIGLVAGDVVRRLIHSSIDPSHAHLAQVFVDYWLPGQLAVFGLGFVLFHLLREQAERRAVMSAERRRRIAWIGCAGAAACCIVFGYVRGRWIPGHIGCSVGFLLLSYGLAHHPIRLLVNRFTRLVGTISYSGYLVHFAAMRTALWALPAERLPMELGAPLPRMVLVLLVSLGLTLAVSLVTYRLIEVPGRRLGAKLIGALEHRRSGRTSASKRRHEARADCAHI